ncbi:hypothetical protein, conserved [Eimeria maxima]|uniref:Uncharacterized protein n=1 Tax=Eimeria maxima TaxID=5804 RepID=U6MB03_EIMMA|nr:hypothetical protein, conserved [Eimeria maxima]CDJ61397.1 hypothetical protein, conserved [Eimeria maxima]
MPERSNRRRRRRRLSPSGFLLQTPVVPHFVERRPTPPAPRNRDRLLWLSEETSGSDSVVEIDPPTEEAAKAAVAPAAAVPPPPETEKASVPRIGQEEGGRTTLNDYTESFAAPCPLLLRDGCCTIRSCQFNHVGFRDPIPPPPPPDEEEERANRWHPKIDVLSPRRGNASPFNANDILLRIRFLLEDKKLTLFNVPPLQFFEDVYCSGRLVRILGYATFNCFEAAVEKLRETMLLEEAAAAAANAARGTAPVPALATANFDCLPCRYAQKITTLAGVVPRLVLQGRDTDPKFCTYFVYLQLRRWLVRLRDRALLDTHNCPFKRRSHIEAIPALHTALHELERGVFLQGADYGKIRQRRLVFNIAAESNTIPLPPLPETRHSLPQQQLTANTTTRRLAPLSAVLRHHAGLLRDASRTMNSPRASEDSDSFCCGSVIDEEEYLGAAKVTIHREESNRRTKYILEDLQL